MSFATGEFWGICLTPTICRNHEANIESAFGGFVWNNVKIPDVMVTSNVKISIVSSFGSVYIYSYITSNNNIYYVD